MQSDRMIEEAIALGKKNLQVIELASNHCSHMTFTSWGGVGFVELETGLPIGTRRIECDYVEGSTASADLWWIARDFYSEHCVDCPHQNPTGLMPTLRTAVTEAQAELAKTAQVEAEAATALRLSWAARHQRRVGLRVGANPAMEATLDDLDAIDCDPGEEDAPDAAGATARLVALAERAPGSFTDEVTDHVCALVAVGVLPVLRLLRRLARTQAPLQRRACELSLEVLREHPEPEAARLVAEQADCLAGGDLTDDVLAHAIWLSGGPTSTTLGHLRDDAGDPTLLRVAADREPDALTACIRAMIPPPLPQSGLVLPPGTLIDPSTIPEPQRAAAAASVRHLAATHPNLAEALVGDLVSHLGVDGSDRYNELAVPSCQSALATLIVLGVGDVPLALEEAGMHASEELRDRLFGVYERALRIVSDGSRGRSGSEPVAGDDDRVAVLDTVIPRVLTHLDGRWGAQVATDASEVVEGLARSDASWAVGHIDVFTSALLDVAEIITNGPPVTGGELQLLTAPDPSAGWKAVGDNYARLAAAHRLVKAIEAAALEDPLSVLPRVVELLDEQRDSERSGEVRWRLLPVLGSAGSRCGHNRAVLAIVLPILRTYLVDADSSLRARALEAWTEVASAQPLPATLVDLLPAYLQDGVPDVVQAVLTAARRLDWPDGERSQLLLHAIAVAKACDPEEHEGVLEDAVQTISALTWQRPERARAEPIMVEQVGRLSGYKRRDLLRLTWLPETEHSPAVAQLRFDQIRANGVVDRFNRTDDDELVDLLRCGAGLLQIPLAQIIAAVREFDSSEVMPVLEIIEVIWRAGRAKDVVTVIQAVLEDIPDVPAKRWIVSTLALLLAAAEADSAALAGIPVGPFEQAIASSLPPKDSDDLDDDIARQIVTVTGLRCALRGADPPTGIGSVPTLQDPADAQRERAARIQNLSDELVAGAVRATPSAELIRAYGALGVAVSYLVRSNAGVLVADAAGEAANRNAARLRARAVVEQLRDFGEDDPIGRAIAAIANKISADVDADVDVADVTAGLARIPIPPLCVRGPRTWSAPAPHAEPVAEPVGPTVAVVLFSLDGSLITGPAVLKNEYVYELTVDAWPGEWPEWATSLELAFISALRPRDIELPTFTWHRSDLEGDRLDAGGTLQLRFKVPAGAASPRFRVAMRWQGIDDDGAAIFEDLDVAGHRELRIRPFDASRDHLTDYPVVDERLIELYERFRTLGVHDDHLQAFCRLFTATCRITLRYTWDKRFKRGTRITERQFHDDLYNALLAEPELGGRLERGNALGLGYLDVRHDGITSELKVERKTAVTRESATKYMGQPTQYAAADGKRLSILCILDLTAKKTPVGSPENYVFPLQPALHGLEDPRYPSAVAVVVVNANLPVPSSWSRRKTATQQAAADDREEQSTSDPETSDGDSKPAS